MAQHDHSYKALFSHREMVRDLLEGFVRGGWLAQVDFDSLERANGSYITDDLRERENDIVWRVRWGKRWVYIYLLIEFQSTVDRYMAVRILSTLIQPGPRSLRAYLPNMRYLLIDEGSYRDSELAALRNLVAALFRLEHSCTSDNISEIVGALRKWLKSPEQRDLHFTFSNWLDEVILPRRQDGQTATVKDLSEMHAMLTERLEVWKAEWKQEGQLQGHRNGEAQLLLRLLQKRFGELPRWVSLRVQQAQSEQLECWGERLLDVQNLDALFDGENVETLAVT